MKKKIIWILISIFLSGGSFAQPVAIEKEVQKIKKEVMNGYRCSIKGEGREVEKSYVNYLKTFGKTKTSKQAIRVEDPIINNITYAEKVLYAMVLTDQTLPNVWLGIHEPDWDGPLVEQMSVEIKRILYQFSIDFERQSVQKKIDETQEAWNTIEKQLAKATRLSSTLEKKQENNAKEEIRLKQAIVDNEKERDELKRMIAENKIEIDSLENVIQKTKKIMTKHQEELKEIK